jgi:YbbR domain-containing protein
MTDGVTFISAVANPLSISVSGPKSVLDTVDSASVRFNLDGKEIKNNLYGYGAIELRNKNGEVINNPYLSLSDSTAYVTVSVKKQKTVPVRVVFNGGAFSSSDATVETSVQSILISGSPDAIDALNEIVLTVDETKISGSGKFEFAVSGLLPKDVHNESNVSRITVKVTLPKLSTRSYVIKKDKITVKNLPVGYGSELNNEITVKLIGVREVLDKIDMNLISASLDFDRVTVEANGTYTAEAEISLGGEYSGVYIQNTDHKVNFSVFAE